MKLPLPGSPDGPDTPVSVVTGFLGSGKTTLINRLLRQPGMQDVAVIVNEFGEVALDHYFMGQASYDVVTLPNGCLCCLAGSDLEETLARLCSSRPPEKGPLRRIVIETSGLADPAPVAQLVMDVPLLTGRLALESIITTVDAMHAEAQLERYTECAKQVALADKIVLTKGDLVGEGQLDGIIDIIAAHNPRAAICIAGQISPDLSGVFGPVPAIPLAAAGASNRRHPACALSHDFASFSIVEEGQLDWPAFEVWFRRLRRLYGDSILRVKGILNVEGCRNPVVIHAIHHVMHPPATLERWPSADRWTKLIFITSGLSPDVLRTEWDQFRGRAFVPPTVAARS